MKYFRRLVWLSVFVGLFCLLFLQEAYAYIDPGTASFFFQLLIAGVLGALFAVKIYWTKVRVFFADLITGKRKQEKKQDDV